jgi:Holliday junction resolvasome RuvABC endonuclease subunit
MRCVGIDISKAEYSALALVVNGEPVSATVFKADKRDPEAVQIDKLYTWFTFKLKLLRPDVVAVEELAVFLNKKTIRALARREGVALLAAKRSGGIVISPSIGSSRATVLRCPANISKDAAWPLIKKMFPDFKFLPANRGGMDQGDALMHAIAAPTHLQRN